MKFGTGLFALWMALGLSACAQPRTTASVESEGSEVPMETPVETPLETAAESARSQLRARCAQDLDHCGELLRLDASRDALENECHRRPGACFELAVRITHTVERPRADWLDTPRAVRVLRSACAREHVASCSLWSVLEPNTSGEAPGATQRLSAACEDQYWPACSELAYRGLVEPDEGTLLYERACSHGYGAACYTLAARLRGEDTHAERARWFARGCAAGHAPSCDESAEWQGSREDACELYGRACGLGGGRLSVCRNYMYSCPLDCGILQSTCEGGEDWACAALGGCFDEQAHRRGHIEDSHRYCLVDDKVRSCISAFYAYSGEPRLDESGTHLPPAVATDMPFAARLQRHGCSLLGESGPEESHDAVLLQCASIESR